MHSGLACEALESRQLLATFTVTSGADSGTGSLREAIDLANTLPGADSIEFLGVSEVRLATSQLRITDSLTIDGSSAAGGVTVTAVDADGDATVVGDGIRVVSIDAMADGIGPVTFHHLNITGGDAAQSGGGIDSRHALVLSEVSVSGNSARVDGGGIHIRDQDLSITNSVLDSNISLRSGGGVFFTTNEYRTLEIQASTISGNTATERGGGLLASSQFYGGGANVRILSSLVEGNRGRFGSAMNIGLDDATGDSGRIEGTTIRHNVNIDRPGYTSANSALQLSISGSGSFEVVDSVIEGNTSTYAGGASIFASYGAQIHVSGLVVEDNVASRRAGGLSLGAGYDGKVFVENSTISGNSAELRGGGVSLTNFGYFYSLISIEDSLISDNEAGLDGGGVFASSFGYGYLPTISIGNSTISGNRAGEGGGGIFSSAADAIFRLDNSTVANNSAGVGGGGIRTDVFSSYFGVRSTIVADNVSGADMPDDLFGDIEAQWSLIEQQTSGPPVTGHANILGVDPGLGPLDDNGGDTLTHALTFASPAVDAGAVFSSPPTFDQRGAPFSRVVRGAADIGAFEWQPLPGPLCDFGSDGVCDATDIDALIAVIAAHTHDPDFDLTFDGLVDRSDRDEWLALAGVLNLPSSNPYLLGDANLDGFVDGQDFGAWNKNKFMSVAAWSAGDWNADGFVDGQDFNAWNTNKFTSSGDLNRSVRGLTDRHALGAGLLTSPNRRPQVSIDGALPGGVPYRGDLRSLGVRGRRPAHSA